MAGADQPGCAPVDPNAMRSDIAALRADVDVVVVLVHWGLMGYELPRPRERDLGAGLIEFGADLVVGSHPHVLQGTRLVGDGLVAHSLGDFAFYPETAAGRTINQYRARQTGAILEVVVAPRRVVSHRLHLTRQRATTVTVDPSLRRAGALRRSTRRVAAGEGGAYRRIWRRYALSRTLRRLVGRLAPWKWRTIRPGTVRGFGVALREIFRRS